MGIVGFGNIGAAVARIALAFGMNVAAVTSKSPDKLPAGVKAVALDKMLSTADVVSLHCPLTDSTRHMINPATLAKMKPSAILINTGRGPLIDEVAVAEALDKGLIAAYCADVLSTEPPQAGNPLLNARNCYLTPHIAWATVEARTRLMDIAAENIRQFLSGEPVANKVN